MPIYDYICSSCKTRTEVIHGIDAPGPRFCPACGAEGTLRKAFAPPNVHFKGSGWAKKDRSSSSGSKARATAGADAGKDGAGDGAADGKKGGSSEASDGSTGGSTGGSSAKESSTAPSRPATSEG